MDFKLSEGPWSRLYEGKFQEYDLEILKNPDKLVLVLIYEKEKEKINESIVQLYLPFYAEGNLEKLIETLPTNVNMLYQHQEGSTQKFLLVSSDPRMIEWKEEKLDENVKEMVKEVKEIQNVMIDVSKAYEVTLSSLKTAGPEISEAFFSQPLIVPALSTGMKEKRMVQTESKAVPGAILLGTTRDKTPVEEPTSLFKTVYVGEGKEINRKHLIHIILEGLMLSNIPVAVFDREKEYKRIALPTHGLEELKAANIEIEPIGFPIKTFESEKDVKVDMSLLTPKAFCELFGIGEPQLINFFEIKMKEKTHTGLDSLIESIKATKPDVEKDINQYLINKALRVILVINNIYPKLFGAKNPIKQVSKAWLKSFGRTGIIDLSGLKKDKRAEKMLINSVLKGILEDAKESGLSKNTRLAVVLPDATEFVSKKNNEIICNEIAQTLNEFEKYGVAYLIESQQIIDLKNELIDGIKAKLLMVSGLDVGIELEGRKQYRIKVRPSLSTSIFEKKK